MRIHLVNSLIMCYNYNTYMYIFGSIMRMNFRPHKAFSLTELIIVLVIIALLFAAMAPIITKRHIADNGSIENIWNFVSNDTERNAYFDPGAADWTSSIYVGMEPRQNYSQSGKLVINSNDITFKGETYPQPQIQFRFSPNEAELSNGIDSGALLVDGSGNVHFGQIHKSIGMGNTVLGFSTLQDAESANGFVAVGTGALGASKITYGDGAEYHVTAIGTNSGGLLNKNYNGNGIFAGAGSGSGYVASNIGLGYHAIYSDSNVNSENNIAIGLNSGVFRGSSGNFRGNVLVNTNATTSGNMDYNTILGYGAYNTGSLPATATGALQYLTSVGFNTCNSIGYDKGINTCIGYGSGSVINGTPDYNNSNTNLDEHIFLGGIPKGFHGRGVMEVHTYRSGSGASVLPNPRTQSFATSASVVLNSNLVVRGKLYVADGSNIANYKFVDSYEANIESKYYRCTTDTYRSVLLTYNVYLCTDDFNRDVSLAHPRTINVLYRDGNNNGIISSDERLKTDIVENNRGLEKLLLLEPYNYTFKSDKLAVPQVGVIAQDLQKIFPESVSKDEKGFLKIRWDEMFYSVINSIKELSLKLEKIAQKIVNMTKEVEVIKAKHENMSKKLSSLDARLKKLERK